MEGRQQIRNLSTATFDASGANQQTTYHYNSKNLLSEIDQPDGGTVSFTYDADGNRLTKTVVSGGPVPTQTLVKDVYQAGRIAYETDGAGTTLATFSYDPNGAPESVVVGSDPNTGPRYYYVYNTHGDVVALVDGSGNIAARYSYDEFGSITDSSETFANGWSNPYRYDGIDRVRYDAETNLYWMSVRAYDPTLGRFISRDPEGRTPLVFATQPYSYAGNNPLRNVDPSGQRYFNLSNPDQQAAPFGAPHTTPGVTTMPGSPPSATQDSCAHPSAAYYNACYALWVQKNASRRSDYLKGEVRLVSAFELGGLGIDAVADFALAWKAPDITDKLIAGISGLISVSGMGQWVPSLITGSEDPSAANAGITWVVGLVNALAGVARVALQAYRQWGGFAARAASLAVDAVQEASGGIVSVVMNLVLWLASPWVNAIFSFVGHELIAMGNAAQADIIGQQIENLEEWCKAHSGVCTDPPPAP